MGGEGGEGLMSDKQFKPGDPVIYVGRHDCYRSTVEKVHKNGNFTLEQWSQQFRQSGHETGESYQGGTVYHEDSNTARRELHRKQVRNVIGRTGEYVSAIRGLRSEWTTEQLGELNAINAKLAELARQLKDNR